MPISTDTIFDAKGDLVAATGNDTASRLAVTTTAGKMLVKNSAASAGLAWSSPWHNALAPSGAISETIPRHMFEIASRTSLNSGQLRLVGIYLPKDVTITSISFVSGDTAVASGTNWWFALYDSSRNLLRQTSDDTTAAWAAYTVKTLNLSSTYTTTAAGFYYVGIMVAATTVPTLLAATFAAKGFVALAPIINGSSTTGLTSTAPDPAGALTASVYVNYGYIS